MGYEPDIAAIAACIADASRAEMLMGLMGGEARPASSLARLAGVTPQTASTHLGRLLDAGLVVCLRQGRHRYYRLASGEVAQLIESLGVLARARPVRSLRQSIKASALRYARTCYDHLAGELGVALAEELARRGCLEEQGGNWALTTAGRAFLEDFGVDVGAVLSERRVFIRPCLDWTERRPHLAGGLGAAIAARCFELGWVERVPKTRALRITASGQSGFFDAFGLRLTAGPSPSTALDR